jgi:hypothetical protein
VLAGLVAACLLVARLFLIDAICQCCVVSDVLIGLRVIACVLRLWSG